MTVYRCSQCHLSYPSQGLPHLCPRCGGVFELAELSFPQGSELLTGNPGVWRFRNMFGLPVDASITYLGEGNTPLVVREVLGQQVAFKLESLNPTGSFKDRGTAVNVSLLLARGMSEVVEDSSGNAGASLAAYTAAFGIKSHIFVPSSASGPKLNQMQSFGADVIPVEGPRENAHQAALDYIAEHKVPYASHALLPFGMAGIATISFELREQLGELPGTVVAPIGHGSLFDGIFLGLQAMQRQMETKNSVKMVGVQPARCAPLVAIWNSQPFTGGKEPTIAEGTQILKPVRGEQILTSLQRVKDELIAIDEEEILPAHDELAKLGFYVEPTSAMVWAAYRHYGSHWPEPIVLILTGSGLKFTPSH